MLLMTHTFVFHKLILGFTALCFLCNIMSWAVLNNTNDYNPILQSGVVTFKARDKLCWNNFTIQDYAEKKVYEVRIIGASSKPHSQAS